MKPTCFRVGRIYFVTQIDFHRHQHSMICFCGSFTLPIRHTDMPTQHPEILAGASIPPIKESVRIIIAKSDRTYAEGLSAICSKIFSHAEISIVTTATEALEALQSISFDFGIFGLRFHDGDGIELLQHASQKRLAKNILVIAEHQDRSLLPSLHTSRLDAIIDTFNETHHAIRNALRLVAKGQVYISPTLRHYLIDRHSSLNLRQNLTAGELRVLRIIGTGCDNLEASQRLKLSMGTVQTHRRSIMRKFKVSSSTKLVFEAIRLGFVQTYSDEPGADFTTTEE